MSNKPSFGRDVNAFLNGLEESTGRAKKQNSGQGIFLISMSPSGDERFALKVRVSNLSGSEDVEFVLLREHVEMLEIDVGRIDEELLPELEYYGEVSRAYSSACASFAYTHSSLRALFKKLLQKGFPKDVCEDAIASVRSRGFVDEEEIALRRAQILVEKHWGASRIVMKLREEGFEDRALRSVRAYFETVDFAQRCAELILKKYGGVPEDRHERELMYASLSRMGYSSGEIRFAMEICCKQL